NHRTLHSFPTRRSSDLNFAEFFPVARLAQPVVAVGEPTRFRRRPAKCVSLVSLAMNDRAVTSHDNLQVFVRLAFDADGLVDDLRDRKSTRLNSSHLGIS